MIIHNLMFGMLILNALIIGFCGIINRKRPTDWSLMGFGMSMCNGAVLVKLTAKMLPTVPDLVSASVLMGLMILYLFWPLINRANKHINPTKVD